ncbi:MAG: hydroxyacid dehydrogenase [Clostridia bacterium]|nr:hydroxyacid dehydrogenase [Clostridia bacterium]
MEKLTVVVLDASTLGDDLDLTPLQALGEVKVYQTSTPEEIAIRIADADILMQNKAKLTADLLAKATKLKVICEAATGFDNIDVAYCREHGIAVTNVPGYSTQCVAQITFTLALSLITHLPQYTSFVQSGEYTASGVANRLSPAFHELYGKTWGIVGYGNIGKQVGKIAEAFGCNVIVHKRTPEEGVRCVDIDTLCRESDVISLHTPLNDGTRGLIGRAQLDMMKKNAILVNVARGAVTDEEAVADALLSGKLAGFGCDVYSAEPFPAGHPIDRIKDLPNVCLTPHIAWGGYETRVRLLDEMIKNAQAFFRGEKRNRVD